MNLNNLVPFKTKNGVTYYESNREFFAVGKTHHTFCFSDFSLENLEKKVERALIFNSKAATSQTNRRDDSGINHEIELGDNNE